MPPPGAILTAAANPHGMRPATLVRDGATVRTRRALERRAVRPKQVRYQAATCRLGSFITDSPFLPAADSTDVASSLGHLRCPSRPLSPSASYCSPSLPIQAISLATALRYNRLLESWPVPATR